MSRKNVFIAIAVVLIAGACHYAGAGDVLAPGVTGAGACAPAMATLVKTAATAMAIARPCAVMITPLQPVS